MQAFDIRSIGWTDERNKEYTDFIESTDRTNLLCGRVIGVHHDIFELYTAGGFCTAKPLGSLRQSESWPVTGDWVLYMPLDVPLDGHASAVIHHVLSRSSFFTRLASGKRTGQQGIAANIDYVGIVAGLDREYNLRRIERYMTLAWDSGAEPVLVLNKADLAEDPQQLVREAELSAPGARVMAVSAAEGSGLDDLRTLLADGSTAVLVGSSGVGKSTLVNALSGSAEQKIGDVREGDGRGRHTTTARELFVLPTGGALIDTPGMREVGLRTDGSGLESSFEEISELASGCRFTDCTHRHEPGCAVLEALRTGEITRERYEAYQKQLREIEFIEDREEALRRKEAWEKDVAREIRKFYRENKGRKGKR
jgi:ribosome biogenesis GTPase